VGQVVLAEEGDLEGEGGDLELLAVLAVQGGALGVALLDDACELLELLGHQSGQHVLLQDVDEGGGLAVEVLAEVALGGGRGTSKMWT